MASKSLTFDIYGRDKTASKTLDGIGKSASGMGKTFAKVGKVIAAAAAIAVVAWAKSSVDSLARIEKINAQTTAVLKSTGNAANVSAKHIEDLATALERKTATEGESIQEGANLLLTFKNIRNEAGKGNDIFDQTTGIMVDLARAMGTDAPGAALQLGKALNDPIKGISALSRVGITFTEDQENLIKSLVESGDMMGAQKVILGELQSQFGGSGAAFAETFAGKVDLIGHAWGEVGEAVFTKAMPMLADLADWVLAEGIPALNDFFDGIEKNKDILGPAAIAVGGLTTAIIALNAAMALNPIILLIGAIGALVGIIAGFGVALNTNVEEVDDWAKGWVIGAHQIRDAWNGTVTGFQTGAVQLSDFFTSTTGMFRDFFVNTAGMFVDFFVNTTGMFRNFFVNTAGMFVGFFTNTAGMLVGFFSNTIGMFRNFGWNVLSFFGWMWANVAGVVANGINGVMGHIGGLPGRVMGALSGAGGWLRQSGRDLIQGFINGITDMIRNVGRAVGRVMNFASGFFPHSPAKRGPFSGSGWRAVLKSGTAIGDQFGAGLAAAEPSLTAQFGAMVNASALTSRVDAVIAGLVDAPSRTGFGGVSAGGTARVSPGMAPATQQSTTIQRVTETINLQVEGRTLAQTIREYDRGLK